MACPSPQASSCFDLRVWRRTCRVLLSPPSSGSAAIRAARIALSPQSPCCAESAGLRSRNLPRCENILLPHPLLGVTRGEASA